MKWPWQKERSVTINPLPFQEYVNWYAGYNGHQYPLSGLNQTMPGSKEEPIGRDFEGLARSAYKANGVVFACILVRLLLFSEARFQFRRIRNGKPGDLFGSESLAKLEKPWPGGTTGDLLARMEQDASLAGNFFGLDRGSSIRRLRPDWVTIVLASNMDTGAWDPEAEVIGYAYTPGGPYSGQDPLVYLVEEVCHYAPIPDPEASFRGMSWLTPIVAEIMADKSATSHKLAYFENGGTPNILVEFDPEVVKTKDEFDKWMAAITDQLGNQANQHRALFLGGGTKGHVVGSTLEQIEFKTTQGAGETRIAAAAGVPPVIVGLSEGLDAATYSNYAQARRRLADGTMRPLWRNAAASLAKIVDVPAGAELWYDDRDIPFLREDRKDLAEIQGFEATIISTLLDAGFIAESVIAAVTNEDWTRLEHSGLFSVQLQPAGTTAPEIVLPSLNGDAEPVPQEA